MEENDLRDLESMFAQVEDPRMERAQAAPITGYHHAGDVWSAVWSRWMGGDRGIWQSQRSVFDRAARFAQWNTFSRYVWARLRPHLHLPRKTGGQTCQSHRFALLKRGMGDWKHGNTGRSTIPLSWLIWTLHRSGRACGALAWCAPRDRSTKR